MIDFRRVRIQGYATCFDQIGDCGGGALEFIAPNAFADFLSQRRDVSLNFASHAGEALGKVSSLFADEFGLGFEATLDLSAHAHRSIPHAICNGCDGASIGMTNFRAEVIETMDGPVRQVVEASIDHITVAALPVYRGTATWLADADLARAPRRIQDAATKWERGLSTWRANAKARASAAAAARRNREFQNWCDRTDRIIAAGVVPEKLRACWGMFNPSARRVSQRVPE